MYTNKKALWGFPKEQKKSMRPKQQINSFLSVFDDSIRFKIAIIKSKGDARDLRPRTQIVSKEGLLNMIPYLKFKNYEGYNIFYCPIGWQYVLIDDLDTKEKLEKCASLRPMLLVETSPKNYQAFLHLRTSPINREHALQICRKVANLAGGDPGAAKPDQPARMPTFTNRKIEHYRKGENGGYPYAKLKKFEKRFSNYWSDYEKPELTASSSSLVIPHSAFVDPFKVQEVKNRVDAQYSDLSIRDFHFIIGLKHLGFSIEQSEQELSDLLFSENRLQMKSRDYIPLTVSKVYSR